jgi:hypothetical protein
VIFPDLPLLAHTLPTLIAMVLVVGVLLLMGLAMLMAYAMLHPPRMTDGKAVYLLKRLSPGDLGLPYHDMRFRVRDWRYDQRTTFEMAAWWIAAASASDRCCILIHGHSDAKVGGIAWAPLMHSLGWNVLAIDQRAHGESGGAISTAGYYERYDVSQIIDQLRAMRPAQTHHLILFGISMGAAVATATAVLRSEDDRTSGPAGDLEAIILESPYADFATTVGRHARLTGMPALFLLPLAVRLAEWFSGARFGEVRPVDLIARVPCPLLVIQSGDDPLVNADAVDSVKRAVQTHAQRYANTRYWHVDECGHVLGLCADPDTYRQQVEEFLPSIAATAPAAALTPMSDSAPADVQSDAAS